MRKPIVVIGLVRAFIPGGPSYLLTGGTVPTSGPQKEAWRNCYQVIRVVQSYSSVCSSRKAFPCFAALMLRPASQMSGLFQVDHSLMTSPHPASEPLVFRARGSARNDWRGEVQNALEYYDGYKLKESPGLLLRHAMIEKKERKERKGRRHQYYLSIRNVIAKARPNVQLIVIINTATSNIPIKILGVTTASFLSPYNLPTT